MLLIFAPPPKLLILLSLILFSSSILFLIDFFLTNFSLIFLLSFIWSLSLTFIVLSLNIFWSRDKGSLVIYSLWYLYFPSKNFLVSTLKKILKHLACFPAIYLFKSLYSLNAFLPSSLSSSIFKKPFFLIISNKVLIFRSKSFTLLPEYKFPLISIWFLFMKYVLSL